MNEATIIQDLFEIALKIKHTMSCIKYLSKSKTFIAITMVIIVNYYWRNCHSIDIKEHDNLHVDLIYHDKKTDSKYAMSFDARFEYGNDKNTVIGNHPVLHICNTESGELASVKIDISIDKRKRTGKIWLFDKSEPPLKTGNNAIDALLEDLWYEDIHILDINFENGYHGEAEWYIPDSEYDGTLKFRRN